ncbi:MAG: hypothetical protein H6737_23050 [Alphaproteobacteria bacterium]|nr:hypothetical protein [Alphaproteobacteria bacterium]
MTLLALLACAGPGLESPVDTALPPAAPVEDAAFEDMAGYVAACEAVLGPVPSLSCASAIEVPITVTDASGVHPVASSADLEDGTRCDRPSVGGCGAGTRIGVEQNDAGTSFVYGCRNYDDDPAFDQINVVATNDGGLTCFFSTRHRANAFADGVALPHPGSGATVPGLPGQPFWYTLEEQLGSPCVECHDNDPLLRNPWVDQAGNVPELDPLRPYRLVGADRLAQGAWHVPPDIVHPDTAPCRACHRLAAGYSGCFMSEVAGGRGRGLRTAAYSAWPLSVWMPHRDPGVLVAGYPTESDWESAFGGAMDALGDCCSETPDPACFAP